MEAMPPPPVEAPPLPLEGAPGRVGSMPQPELLPRMANNLGRDKLADWNSALWDRIDHEVDCETARARIVTQFMPRVVPASVSARTVPADSIQRSREGTLSINEGVELGLTEESVAFTLTKQQYQDEEWLGTAATLATRAANQLARQMDLAAFTDGDPGNLTGVAGAQTVGVPDQGQPGKYGENTFQAVAEAYSLLQDKGHYGTFALALHAEQFADAHAPLEETLIMPADRIRPIMTGGFYGTGTLPKKRGVMVSTGGNTMDVAVGVEPVTAFAQVDEAEVYRFRVYQRFTIRIKVTNALVLLAFA